MSTHGEEDEQAGGMQGPGAQPEGPPATGGYPYPHPGQPGAPSGWYGGPASAGGGQGDSAGTWGQGSYAAGWGVAGQGPDAGGSGAGWGVAGQGPDAGGSGAGQAPYAGWPYGAPTYRPADLPPPGPPRRMAWLPIAAVAGLIGALVGGAIGGVVAYQTKPTTPAPVIRQIVVPNGGTIAKPTTIRGILAKVEPGVVSIRTNLGAGTGMILSPDGEVLTNAHVINGASTIKVTLFSETTGRNAHLLGFDAANDVALVKIDAAQGLSPVQLGDSGQLQVGDDVVAIGNALNLAGGPTVTSGIVSALDRALDDPTLPQDLIQTDAAINPGNSGGPLVNADGQVVGMNTLVIQQATAAEAAQNLGFAIAINNVKPLLVDLRKGVTRATPYLGVSIVTLTPDIAQRFNIKADHGAIIQDLLSNGPASQAGLQQDDVIVTFDGKDVTSDSGLVSLTRAHQPGDKVQLTYIRGQTSHTATVTLGTKPATSGG